MLPIRDDNPIRARSIVTWLLIGSAAFVYFLVQPKDQLSSVEFLYAEATIPCEVITAEPLAIDEINEGFCQRGGAPGFFQDKSILFSLVASIFLHGSLMHLLGNLWIFYIFGNNIEDELGNVRFLIFYLGSGVVASLAHVVVNPSSTIPVVGASGAVAAVMGAYLVLHPSARVTSVIPPFIFWPFRVPAFVFLGIWSIGQFGLAGQQSEIAWEAHVGGFVVGILSALVVRSSRRGNRDGPQTPVRPEPEARQRRDV